MPIPSKIQLQRRSNVLCLDFGDEHFELPAEFLRVHSPSAEVKGHGPGQAILQHGKIAVRLIGVEAQGNYAIRLVFSDGHDSGIYSWDYLYALGKHQDEKWQDYLLALHNAGKTRDPAVTAIKLMNP